MSDKTIAKGSPGSTSEPSPVARFYEQLLENASSARAAGDIETALVWIRQAEFVGLVTMKLERVPAVNEAYAALVVHTCRRAYSLAVKSGNITREHLNLAQHMATMAERLTVRMQDGDPAHLAQAAVLEGHAHVLAAELRAFLDRKPLYTPVATLDSALDRLTAIVTSARQLGIKLEAPWGGSKEILDQARLAVDNARHYLSWIWPAVFSDWDKAAFMSRRARQLLARHVEVEGAGAAGASPMVDHISGDLTRVEEFLAKRDYKGASRLLKHVAEIHLANM